MHRRSWLVTGFIVASLALAAGCDAGHTETAGSGDEDKPAKVLPIQGTDVRLVVLTAHAAERVGIKTEPVREVAAPDSGARNPAVPVTALLYDNTGATWVYTSTQPLTYVRQRVVVARIEGNLAVLRSGPAPGTAVTTVGAAELLGTEYGVEGQ
jgi:hypothetical protein